MKRTILWKVGQRKLHFGGLKLDKPVDRGNGRILGEWSWIRSVHSPDGVAPLLNVITWYVEGVVEAGDHNNKP